MSGPRVLVVDDEPQIQRFLTVALTAAGFQVQTAETGAQALRRGGDRRARSHRSRPRPARSGRQGRSARHPPVLNDAGDHFVRARPRGGEDRGARSWRGRLCREAVRHRRIDCEAAAALRHAAQAAPARSAGGDCGRRHGLRQASRHPRRSADQADAEGIRPARGPLSQRRARRHSSTNSGGGLGPGAHEDTQYLRVFIGQLRAKIERDPTTPTIVKTEPGVGYRAAEA